MHIGLSSALLPGGPLAGPMRVCFTVIAPSAHPGLFADSSSSVLWDLAEKLFWWVFLDLHWILRRVPVSRLLPPICRHMSSCNPVASCLFNLGRLGIVRGSFLQWCATAGSWVRGCDSVDRRFEYWVALALRRFVFAASFLVFGVALCAKRPQRVLRETGGPHQRPETSTRARKQTHASLVDAPRTGSG